MLSDTRNENHPRLQYLDFIPDWPSNQFNPTDSNRQRFDVYACDELLEKIHEVSSRPKILTRIGDDELDDFFRIIYAFCRMAKIEQQAQSKIRDPKDLYLLSLAESIEADYIVSGDADLLDLQQHGQTKMIKLVDFKAKFLEN